MSVPSFDWLFVHQYNDETGYHNIRRHHIGRFIINVLFVVCRWRGSWFLYVALYKYLTCEWFFWFLCVLSSVECDVEVVYYTKYCTVRVVRSSFFACLLPYDLRNLSISRVLYDNIVLFFLVRRFTRPLVTKVAVVFFLSRFLQFDVMIVFSSWKCRIRYGIFTYHQDSCQDPTDRSNPIRLGTVT
jgi:hypothetical protein